MKIEPGGLQSSVLRRWLLSYLAILLLPLLLSIAIYFYSRQIIIGNAEEIYTAALEQAKTEVDNQLTSLYQILDQITVNSYVRTLSAIHGKPGPEEYFIIYKLVGDIRQYPVIFPLLDDALVVLNRNGSAVGINGHMSLDLLYSIFYQNEEISLTEFKALLENPGRRAVYEVNGKLLFLQTTEINDIGEAPPITAALVINRSKFEKQYLKNIAAQGGILYVTYPDGRIIAGTDKLAALGVVEELAENPDSTRIRLDGISYYSLRSKLAISGWEFHYLIPLEIQGRKARQIQIFTFAGFLICALFGVFFSFRMSRRGYNLQTDLSKNLQILRKYYLYTLLEKPFDPVKDQEDMKRYDLNLPGDHFLVILFKGEQPFLQRFREIAGRDFALETTDVGPAPAAIVSWQGEREDAVVLLEDAIESAQGDGDLSVSAVLGDVHTGPEGIYYSNQEAREALQYLDAQNGQTILHYADIKYAGDSYQYPLEIEQQLINSIRLGDEENALALLRQVLGDNIAQESFPGYMTGILASDLLGTFMKGRTVSGETPLIFANPENLPARELPRFLETTLIEICRANRRDLEEKKAHRWGEKIKTYIDENFKNPDLNISITALHFDLTPAYLSNLFREETGLNLLEYINTLRIGESKKLLEQGCSIIKTAELAGFRGSGNFIRIFRKITGVTPGQYKNIG
jgi:AraC-like DNA-binding protein